MNFPINGAKVDNGGTVHHQNSAECGLCQGICIN